MNSKVLITGADGFTGFYLSAHLERCGYQVFKTSAQRKDDFLYCDICDKDSVKDVLSYAKPNFVIHLAAISFAPSDPSLIYKVNVEGSRNLLGCLQGSDIRPERIILASSASVYGEQKTETLSENLQPNPISPYAKSKFEMEKMTSNYDLDVIITRPFNYTGVRQPNNFLIPKIVSHFKDEKLTIELGNLTPKREYNSVLDVVKIYERLLGIKSDYKIFNIGSGAGYSVGDIVNFMKEISNRDIKVVQNPNFMRSDEAETILSDASRLKEHNLDFCKTHIKETLKWMYEN